MPTVSVEVPVVLALVWRVRRAFVIAVGRLLRALEGPLRLFDRRAAQEVASRGRADGKCAGERDGAGHHRPRAGKNELDEGARALAEREAEPDVDAHRPQELGSGLP